MSCPKSGEKIDGILVNSKKPKKEKEVPQDTQVSFEVPVEAVLKYLEEQQQIAESVEIEPEEIESESSSDIPTHLMQVVESIHKQTESYAPYKSYHKIASGMRILIIESCGSTVYIVQ